MASGVLFRSHGEKLWNPTFHNELNTIKQIKANGNLLPQQVPIDVTTGWTASHVVTKSANPLQLVRLEKYE